MAGFTVRVTIGFMVRPSRLVRAQLKVGTTVRREQPPAPRQLPVLPHFRCSSRPRDQGKALRCLALPTSRTALVSNRQQARNRPRTSFSLNGITVLVLLYLHRKCGRTSTSSRPPPGADTRAATRTFFEPRPLDQGSQQSP